MNEKIKYKDLSASLKIAVIVSYIMLTLWVISFLVGFISGFLGL